MLKDTIFDKKKNQGRLLSFESLTILLHTVYPCLFYPVEVMSFNSSFVIKSITFNYCGQHVIITERYLQAEPNSKLLKK